MAFYDNINEDETSEKYRQRFQEYCNWCWGHGFGNCDNCQKAMKRQLLKGKLREFKKRNILKGENQ